MVTPTNHAIARAGLIFCEAFGILEIFATFFCLIQVKTKEMAHHLRAGPLAQCHIMVNLALVIALRL